MYSHTAHDDEHYIKLLNMV